jgi:hypothetical protein
MAHSSLSPPRKSTRSLWHEAPLWMHLVVIVVSAVLAGGFVVVSTNWPYRHRKIQPMLEDMLASQVKISEYHRTYFPNPGFIAIGITMRRKSAPDLPPLGSVEKMVVQGRWSDLLLLRQRVQLVEITGLHVVVPAIGSRENHEDFPPGSGADFGGPEMMIERFVVRKSLLDIMRADQHRNSFPIANLEIRNFHRGEEGVFVVDMRNAIPTGRIQATGMFGPIRVNDFGATPVSGDFSFSGVALHEVGEISGTLDSSGHFNGTLGEIEAEATSRTPDFAVKNGLPSEVDGAIRCTINGTNGDLAIHDIEAKTGVTTIHASGTIQGSPKITNLDIEVRQGRAEEILRPFLRNGSPIEGEVWLKSHAYVGPRGSGKFLDRLRVDGTFEVPAEQIENKKVEKCLSDFSARAQGLKEPSADGKAADASSSEESSAPRDALSSVKGPATIRNGVASSTQLSFKVAGAEADLKGTFDFRSEVVHLVGNLRMEKDISHTEKGFKSLLLKPLAPFFKKENAGAVVPIAVTGGPGHYKVEQDIGHQK